MTVAVVQATPVFLDRDATVRKACDLIAEAASKGARLVAFPESFVPTYPDWVWAIPAGEEGLLNDLYSRFLDQSITIPGPAVEALGQAARKAKAHVVVGVSERNVEASNASLYNTLLFFDDQGRLMGRHRKLVPTGGERLVWAQGDGSTLRVFDTPLGRIGGLICWENYMPLARYAMYGWGTQLYVAATWDRGQPWLSTVRHIAKEGRVAVLSACIALRVSDIPDEYEFKGRFYAGRGASDWINVGDSAIVDPDGEFLAGPLREQEGILTATIASERLRGPKWMLDVAGHYARPDVFELAVRTEPHPVVRRAPPPPPPHPPPPATPDRPAGRGR